MFDYKKFQICCLEYGKTEADVARSIGISRAAITGWKKGSQPSAASIKKLAKYFDASVEYFMQEKDEATVESSEVDEMREELLKNQDLRMLLSASRNLNEDDIRQLIALADRMNRE